MEPPRNPTDPQDKTTDELLEEMTASRDEAVAHGHDIDAMLEAVTEPMVVYDHLTEVVRTNPAFRALLQRYSHTAATATLQERVEGLALRDLEGELLADAQLPQQRLLHGESITDLNPAQILTRGASGMEGYFRVTGEPLYRDDEVIGAVAFFRDVTEQRHLEGDLTQSQGDLRQSQDELQTVVDTLFDPLFLYDASGRLIRTNAAARRLLPTDAAEYATTPLPERAASYHVRDKQGNPLPHEQWPLARLLRGETLDGDEASVVCVDLADGHEAVFSYTGAPVHDSTGHITGYVALGRDITKRMQTEVELRRSHDELEQRVAQRTHELAVANRTLRHLSQRILAVQENERSLIARELHDEIGQALTGAKMLLGSLEKELREVSNDPADAALPGAQVPSPLDQLEEVHAIVGETLEYVRNLSLELRPAVLDSLGLLPALQWHFERYTNLTGVRVDFSVDGLDHRLPTHLEAGVYRMVQEALTNVARYAGVSAVTVQLYVNEETLSLFIVDEGVGFALDDLFDAGASTGLAGMRERAALLGGTLSIDSLPGEGTTIQADLSILRAIEMEAAWESDQEDVDEEGQRTERDVARDQARDHLRDRERDRWRDAGRDAKRDTTRDALRDVTRDTPRDAQRDAFRDREAQRQREGEIP